MELSAPETKPPPGTPAQAPAPAVGRTVTLGRGTGSHMATIDEDERVVVEWYDHGPDVPYESANQLIFDRAAARLLLDVPVDSDDELLQALAAHFRSYWEVRARANARGVPCAKRVDLLP